MATVPPVLELGQPTEPQAGDKNFIGGLPKGEQRRIRAKARRYMDHPDEFVREARRRMYEHALKLEAMVRYAEDAGHVSQLTAAYRKAVADVLAAHTPKAKPGRPKA